MRRQCFGMPLQRPEGSRQGTLEKLLCDGTWCVWRGLSLRPKRRGVSTIHFCCLMPHLRNPLPTQDARHSDTKLLVVRRQRLVIFINLASRQSLATEAAARLWERVASTQIRFPNVLLVLGERFVVLNFNVFYQVRRAELKNSERKSSLVSKSKQIPTLTSEILFAHRRQTFFKCDSSSSAGRAS